MLHLPRKKKGLRVSHFITAIDREVIARKGDKIDDGFIRQLQEMRPGGLTETEPLTETYHLVNMTSLLKADKYRFMQNLTTKLAKCESVLAAIRINDLISQELTWLERYRYHYDHTLAVTFLVSLMAAESLADEEEVSRAAFCALTHDFGISRVPVEVLTKEGPLDEVERNLLSEHPIYGFLLLNYYGLGQPQLNAAVALEHHENFLKQGYPQAVLSEQPITKFIQIADTFDSLISSRPYRPAHELSSAIAVVEGRMATGRLDAEACELLKSLVLQ